MPQPRAHISTFTIVIKRPNRHHSWGLRIAGGCDLESPIVITKVGLGIVFQLTELSCSSILQKTQEHSGVFLTWKSVVSVPARSDPSRFGFSRGV